MNKQIELGTHEVICQKWAESERGWGERPDGFSLHLSMEGLRRYIETYWSRMPEEAPDEYSYPDGTPYPVGVGDEVFEQIKARDGLRFYSSYEYPGSGGVDGWMPSRTLSAD